MVSTDVRRYGAFGAERYLFGDVFDGFVDVVLFGVDLGDDAVAFREEERGGRGGFEEKILGEVKAFLESP